MTAKESCPECGSEDFDAADDAEHTRATPDRLRHHLVVYICRDCGTAWDAEKPG